MALDILSGILVNESPVLYSFTSAHKEELNKDEPISDPIKSVFFCCCCSFVPFLL